jgi:hypothetical protein
LILCEEKLEICTMAKAKNKYREYLQQYRRITGLTIEELRRRTPVECLRDFFTLMEIAKAMDWHDHTPEEIEEVRRRWKKLKGYGP